MTNVQQQWVREYFKAKIRKQSRKLSKQRSSSNSQVPFTEPSRNKDSNSSHRPRGSEFKINQNSGVDSFYFILKLSCRQHLSKEQVNKKILSCMYQLSETAMIVSIWSSSDEYFCLIIFIQYFSKSLLQIITSKCSNLQLNLTAFHQQVRCVLVQFQLYIYWMFIHMQQQFLVSPPIMNLTLEKVKQLNTLFRQREIKASSIPNDNLRQRMMGIFDRGRAVCHKLLDKKGQLISRLSQRNVQQIQGLIEGDLKSGSMMSKLFKWIEQLWKYLQDFASQFYSHWSKRAVLSNLYQSCHSAQSLKVKRQIEEMDNLVAKLQELTQLPL